MRSAITSPDNRYNVDIVEELEELLRDVLLAQGVLESQVKPAELPKKIS